MKLIYIYFDFTDNGQNPEGYRGFKKCGFNFGTKEYFKMEEPTQEYPNYSLTYTPRPKDEQIEPGFWGDERLYNISALVGDNGVGKSTIIQEIIRCVMGSSKIGITKHGGKYTYYRPFVSVWENTDGMYMVYRTIGDVDFGKLSLSKNILINYQKSQEEFFGKTKLIYFSNALTGSDSQLLVDLGGPCMHPKSVESHDSYYTHPFYNCSLAADIAQAINVSGGQTASIDSYYDTYFNFRSYQEARFLFDRSQRQILSKLKENLPVPCPKSLTIHVHSVFLEHNFEFGGDKAIPWVFRKVYAYFCEHCIDPALFLIVELCVNCIFSFSSFCHNSGYYTIYPPDLIDNLHYQKAEDDYNKHIFPQFLSRDFYTNWLLSVYEDRKSDHNSIIKYGEITPQHDEVYRNCQKYIELLWNNHHIIQQNFVQKAHRTYSIALNDEKNSALLEFMIRFVNLTRAVSHKYYFVIYNWGLSSGESNLLHVLTKLRYCLLGSYYDYITDTSTITDTESNVTTSEPRKECLINYIEDEQECDSVILFFDEADLTLHPEWQRQFVSILAAYLPMLYKDPYYESSESSGCKDIQIILSTHSPIMLGDFPSASVIYLKKDGDGITVNDQSTLHTFGQNIYTILKEGFYLGKGTVGELAKKKIEDVLNDLKDIQNPNTRDSKTQDEWKSRLEMHQKQTIRHLPKGIIRNKLEEEIAKCRVLLGEKPESMNPDVQLLMQTNKELLEENIRLQKQLDELKNKGQNHDQN